MTDDSAKQSQRKTDLLGWLKANRDFVHSDDASRFDIMVAACQHLHIVRETLLVLLMQMVLELTTKKEERDD